MCLPSATDTDGDGSCCSDVLGIFSCGFGGQQGGFGGQQGNFGALQNGFGASQGCAGGSPNMRPGDWTCPNCQDHVFAKNDACRRCGTPKSAAGGCGGGGCG